MSYQVELDAFHGPMDLLLYLVQRSEVDLLDIPIARIAGQFLDYLQLLERLDIDLAGEFLVVAATLMEIKSRLLLPREEVAEEPAEDPRRELVRQLLEYRKFKDAAQQLERLSDARADCFTRDTREPEPSLPRGTATPIKRVELWDLVTAFGRLMRELTVTQPRQVIADDTPQHVYEAMVREQLSGGPRPLRELFRPPHHRVRLIGIFLAVLELMKQQQIWLEQASDFGEITLRLREFSGPAAAA